jgi:predicted secreted protein
MYYAGSILGLTIKGFLNGGTHTWKFKALGKGTAKIVFEYKRPWERDQKPVETKVYTVIVE